MPQGGAEGEALSPTQPFPTHVPDLMPQRFTSDDMLDFPPLVGSPSCAAKLSGLRNDGLYTPPTIQGTLEFPMTGGGVNWGGVAFDPVNQILYANTSYAAHIIKLLPRAETEGFKVLVSDVGDGRAALYSKNSATSGDWSDPSYITGTAGPAGPYTEITIGPTTTLPAGSSATVTPVVIDADTVRLDFGLPKGADGSGTGDVVGPGWGPGGGAIRAIDRHEDAIERR